MNDSKHLPYAANCVEYEEQTFGTMKTPKKPETSSTTKHNQAVKRYTFIEFQSSANSVLFWVSES